MSEQLSSFKGQFLIAMPSMDDDHFEQSVNYIFEHNTEGAFGLSINKPSSVEAETLLSQLEVEPEIGQPPIILNGGPVKPEVGFVMFDEYATEAGQQVDSIVSTGLGIGISSSLDILRQAIQDFPHDKYSIIHGYAGWEAGQLEAEIADNAWLVSPPRRSLFFDTPIQQRWEQASKGLGVNIHDISSDYGHA